MINRIKRQISRIILFSMLVSCIVISYPKVFAAKNYDTQIDFITSLGVTGFTKDGASQLVTRGNFAVAMAQALGMNAEEEIPNTYFDDVQEGSECYTAVSFLAKQNIVRGYEDGSFAPDENITYNEAVKIALSALGYDVYAEVVGGYYVGYMQTAGRIGLDFSVENVNELTRGETANLIYKMLNSYYVELGAASSTGISYKESDELLLKKVFDLEEREGIVTSTKLGTVYGSDAEEQDEIIIDYIRYHTTASKINSFLGMKVKYYTTEDNVVVYLEQARKVTVTEAEFDKIEDDTTARSFVLEEGRRTKTYNVTGNAFYIYNGDPISNPSDEDVKPEYGDIKLIDNDGDNKIDVVIIWSYKSYVISKATQERISLKENSDKLNSIRLDNDDMITTVLFGNNFMDTKLLDTGNVITYAKSKDEGRQTLFVNIGELEARLESLNTQDLKATLDGEEYGITPYAQLSAMRGKTTLFYIDKNNRIVDYQSFEEARYGLLLQMVYDASEDCSYIKILNENGITRYTLTEDKKVKYGVGSEENAKRMLPSEMCNLVLDGKEKADKQLIMYNLTSDGESIASIITPEITDDTVPQSDAEENTLRLSYRYESDTADASIYRQQLTVPNDSTRNYLDVSTFNSMVICVSENEDNCEFTTLDEYMGAEDRAYLASFTAYNRTRLGWYKYLVIEVDSGSGSGSGEGMIVDLTTNAKVLAVTDVSNIYDEATEEIKYIISGYTVNDSKGFGTSVSLEKHISEELLNASIKPTSADGRASRYEEGTIKYSDIKVGDIILYDTNAMSGKISAFGMLCKAEDMTTDYCNNDYGSATSRLVMNATVQYIDEKGIRFTTPGYDGTAIPEDYRGIITTDSKYPNEVMLFRGWTEYDGYVGGVYRYSSKSGTYSESTWDDINIGDRVFTFRNGSWEHTRCIYIIIE